MNRTIAPSAAAASRAGVNADALMKQLVASTPAQIDAWMAANVTTLAQARAVIALLAKAVALLWNQQGSV